MFLDGLTSDQEINWERAFISQLLANQKLFLRENEIKLVGKVFFIILETLKDQDMFWYNYKEVQSHRRMLQWDELTLHYMGLKVTA